MTAQAARALVLPSETKPEASVGSGIGSTTVIANDWAPSNGKKIQTDLAIVLQNVAHGYKKPNILDVKLGARLWADDAPESKKAKLNKIAEESTSKPLGFRITGMKTYQGARDDAHNGITPDGYKFFDKFYGRSFTVENVDEGFGDYFLLDKEARATGAIRQVIKRFIDDLTSMQGVIQKKESRMYSTSLLFVYEGDRSVLQDAFQSETAIINSLEHQRPKCSHSGHGNGRRSGDDVSEHDEDEEEIKFPAIQSLKLIDFAHAEWTPGQGPDENTLHGISNVIKVLKDLV